jgi:hypothetical protein
LSDFIFNCCADSAHLFLFCFSEQYTKPEGRRKLRVIEQKENELKRSRSASVQSDVVTRDESNNVASKMKEMRENEMNIVAITKLLDSKQRTLASLVQQNATQTSVAIAVTNSMYDENNIFWKQVMQSAGQIAEQQQEIKKIENTLLACTEKRQQRDMEGVTISYSTPVVSTTPTASAPVISATPTASAHASATPTAAAHASATPTSSSSSSSE